MQNSVNLFYVPCMFMFPLLLVFVITVKFGKVETTRMQIIRKLWSRRPKSDFGTKRKINFDSMGLEAAASGRSRWTGHQCRLEMPPVVLFDVRVIVTLCRPSSMKSKLVWAMRFGHWSTLRTGCFTFHSSFNLTSRFNDWKFPSFLF